VPGDWGAGGTCLRDAAGRPRVAAVVDLLRVARALAEVAHGTRGAGGGRGCHGVPHAARCQQRGQDRGRAHRGWRWLSAHDSAAGVQLGWVAFVTRRLTVGNLAAGVDKAEARRVGQRPCAALRSIRMCARSSSKISVPRTRGSAAAAAEPLTAPPSYRSQLKPLQRRYRIGESF